MKKFEKDLLIPNQKAENGPAKILVIGSLNMDLAVEIDHIPEVGETILSRGFATVPGGKGANQACAVGRLMGGCAFIGAVGNDGYGKLLQESLHNFRVDTKGLIMKPEKATGMAVVMVNKEGNNSIVVVPGANGGLTPENIAGHRNLIEENDILVMQLEIPLETVLYAAKLAKSLGKTVILDPAPVPEDFPEELYQYIDIMKPNETELARLTGISAKGTGYVRGAEFLRRKGVKNVLVTLGEKGAYLDSEKEGKAEIPACPVKAVDTTAAGDAFTAAVAAKLGEGAALREAAGFAAHVSSIVVTRKGAQSSIPTMEEVNSRNVPETRSGEREA